MAKPIIPTTYLLHGNRVEIMPYFLYEVSVYKITKNMASLMGSCYYKSDKILTIKDDVTIKKINNCNIIRYVDLLAVTKEFVEENNLPMYDENIKKKPKKKRKK